MNKFIIILLLFCANIFAQKQSYYSPENDKKIFVEQFNNEFELRKNGCTPTSITFRDGIGYFNGTSSRVEHDFSYNGTVSVRIRYSALNPVASDYLFDLRNADESETEYASFTNSTTFTSSSGTRYVDGVASSTVSGTTKDIVVTGITANISTLHMNCRNGSALYTESTNDIFEIYEGTLTASEVLNLFNNSRYVEPIVDYAANITGTRGLVEDKQKNTITNTATTIFKDGSISVMDFNGTTSVVGTTLAHTIKTISFWAKPNGLTQSIIDLGGGNTITISGGTLTAAWADTKYVNGVTGTTLLDNQWSHVVLTDVGTTITAIDIGKEGANFFTGKLNDVKITTSLLNANECSRLYTSTKQHYK